MADVKEIIDDANALLYKDHEQAASMYKEVIAAAPDDERGYCGMALAFNFMNKHQDVVSCMEKLIEIRPDAAYAYGFMGSAAEDDGQKEKALACYEKMLEIDPHDMAAKFKRACMMSSTGRVKDDKYYWKVLNEKQRNKTADKVRRMLLLACIKTIGGDVSSNDAIIATPGMRQIMDILFEWKTESGFLEYAYPDMQDISEQDPDQMLERANELADVGKFAEAIKAADEAIAEYPDFAEVYSAKTSFLTKMDRYEEAVACVNQILRIKPDEIDDLGIKGMLLEKVGRPAEAAACYDRITELNPGDMIARYLKCGLLATAGDMHGLAECYRSALEAEPEDEKSADMQKSMRIEHRELMRRAKATGSLESGFAKFMRKVGVGIEPKWGRANAAARPVLHDADRPTMPKKRTGRMRVGRRR